VHSPPPECAAQCSSVSSWLSCRAGPALPGLALPEGRHLPAPRGRSCLLQAVGHPSLLLPHGQPRLVMLPEQRRCPQALLCGRPWLEHCPQSAAARRAERRVPPALCQRTLLTWSTCLGLPERIGRARSARTREHAGSCLRSTALFGHSVAKHKAHSQLMIIQAAQCRLATG